MTSDLELLIVSLAIGGAIFNARRMIEGFYIWFIANVLGVIFFFSKGLYGFAILYSLYAALNVYGYSQWKKLP
jgi:nicotinamide riboside transporter PnuC